MNWDIPRQEKELESVDFESLALSDLRWETAQTTTYQESFQQELDFKISIDNELFDAEIKKSTITNEQRKGDESWLIYIQKDKDTYVLLSMDVIFATSELPQISTIIERADPSHHLPRKLGFRLHQKIFPFFQYYANSHHKPLKHVVEKAIDIYDPPGQITSGKWDEIFLPTLEAKGYKRVDPSDDDATDWEKWEKTYYPET